ncbi:malignant fibrous histiocytoma-amplified sequence 1 homolog [Watersipora subatra]|uniref:malignant fibrous histiocytoma-amplified sequence 1 homolog n=1 Tax=Watersipora subatra TaxID=2589382 RepID=UPI00355C59CE
MCLALVEPSITLIAKPTLSLTAEIFSAVPTLILSAKLVIAVPIVLSRLSSFGLSQLSHLEVLQLWGNEFSEGLPGVICNLTSLKSLAIARCRISQLPERLSQLSHLEFLQLWVNDFSEGLPEVICNLTSLKSLDVAECKISQLPERLKNLSQLDRLDCEGNELTTVPADLFQCRKLRSLNLAGNRKLSSIDQSLLEHEHLSYLYCEDCPALVSPPYAVCSQGIEAVKAYFEDLVKDGVELNLVPVSIVGDTMAGKTSLIRSLQSRSRKLTYRDDTSIFDETTRVFDVQNLELENSQAKMIDHGGHQIYHITYRYILKERNIPLLVVNLEKFKNLAKNKNAKIATEQLCWRWVSHLYLACPLLGPPLLVLTHSDKLSDRELRDCKENIFKYSTDLRNQVLEAEKLRSRKNKALHKIEFLSDKKVDVFTEENTFVFGNESHQIEELRKALDDRCVKFKVTLPKEWNDLCNFVEHDFEKPAVALSEIQSKYPKEKCLHILRYMHNVGQVLWYESINSLKGFIFRDIPKMTAMIATLFHHRSREEWQQRIKNFKEFDHNGKNISKPLYMKSIDKFLKCGILDEFLLHHLLHVFKTESNFPCHLAIELLKSFWILHGPIKQNSEDQTSETRYDYIVPYFATESIGASWQTDERIQLRVVIEMRGLPLPHYAFQLMTVAVLDELADDRNTTLVKNDGATVYYDELALHLIHNVTDQKVTLQSSSDEVTNLENLWKRLAKTTQSVLKVLFTAWTASQQSVYVYCGHCLFLRDQNPETSVDPSWFHPKGDSLAITQYSGEQKLTCERTGIKKPTVPSALMRPCYPLGKKKERSIKRYLTSLSLLPQITHAGNIVTVQAQQEEGDPSDQNSPVVAVGPVHVQAPEEGDPSDQNGEVVAVNPVPVQAPEEGDLSDSELSDTLVDPDQDAEPETIRPCIKLRVQNLFCSSEVYRMTRVRGRCLIINNVNYTYSDGRTDTRHGSIADGRRITGLFESLDFICSEKVDLSGEGMIEEISRETERPEHTDYGMFVLVIMCHGSETGLVGTDGNMVERVVVTDSLSAQSFPGMAQKPKLVILQACSGTRSNRVMTDALPHHATSQHGSVAQPTPSFTPSQTPSIAPQLSIPPRTSSPPPSSSSAGLNTDHLLIWKASFHGHVAYRSPEYGTWFVNAIIQSLSRHACHRDLKTLFESQIQEKVRRRSIDHGHGQQPSFESTLRKRLYLFPGYNLS